MKISTDKQKINELLTRGVENIYPTPTFLEKELKSERQLKVYTGYDPTAATLHIGHGITLMKLRQFQDLGHQVIMLIGDFTGMIGDPSDKLAARQQLTHEKVMENCREYKKQAAAILDFNGKNPVQLAYNSTWLGEMKLKEVLDLTALFTVQQMEARDMFQQRIKEGKPIFIHEFLYPLMQAYDSVVMNVDGEVGGNDQTFNMLVGRDLLKIMKNKEKFVLTMKLLADPTGKKMGKSEGNMVALSNAPEDMFGKVMSWADSMIIGGFELCTKVSMEKISEMGKSLKKGANPRDLKLRLASEVVKTFLGASTAKKAEAHFVSTFSKRETPSDIPEIKPSAYDIVTVLVESKICTSKTDARRQIEQSGVKVNGEKVSSFEEKVKKGDVVQKGSRWFVKVI